LVCVEFGGGGFEEVFVSDGVLEEVEVLRTDHGVELVLGQEEGGEGFEVGTD
jgi:hypothetical protein